MRKPPKTGKRSLTHSLQRLRGDSVKSSSAQALQKVPETARSFSGFSCPYSFAQHQPGQPIRPKSVAACSAGASNILAKYRIIKHFLPFFKSNLTIFTSFSAQYNVKNMHTNFYFSFDNKVLDVFFQCFVLLAILHRSFI